jgi:sugar lactone lactonase YvrE
MMTMPERWLRRVAVAVAIGGLVASSTLPAAAAPKQGLIVLPGATATEGVASGRGATFFAGDLFTGNIFRGDVNRGTASLFIHAPADRNAVGMKFDASSGLLFVAGGAKGQGYVYDTNTGTPVKMYQFAATTATFINDVALAPDAAWFTDSSQPKLYRVPLGRGGAPDEAFSTLMLSGPAAATPGAFNLNGIAATPSGATLIVAHSAAGALYTVNPTTGASALISGVSVPNVDGILLEAGRLFAVQNTDNQVDVVKLSPDLSSGVIEQVIRNDNFHVPATVARFGSRLVLSNTHFDTGVPPSAPEYEVVIVDR